MQPDPGEWVVRVVLVEPPLAGVWVAPRPKRDPRYLGRTQLSRNLDTTGSIPRKGMISYMAQQRLIRHAIREYTT
jgi:hypothetical protein